MAIVSFRNLFGCKSRVEPVRMISVYPERIAWSYLKEFYSF